MIGLSTLVTAFTLILLGAATAGPLKPPLHWNSQHNTLECPGAHGTKYVGPNGGQFGILCGWDTHSSSHYLGPYYGISFKECIHRCSQHPRCGVATYTGTCYLKESNRNYGYFKTGRVHDKTALKLGSKKVQKELHREHQNS